MSLPSEAGPASLAWGLGDVKGRYPCSQDAGAEVESCSHSGKVYTTRGVTRSLWGGKGAIFKGSRHKRGGTRILHPGDQVTCSAPVSL